MDSPHPPTILCLASYEKGHAFLRACKQQGATVLLITSLSLKETAAWPRDSLDDIFYMPDTDKQWDVQQTILAVSHLARSRPIDVIVPLDDFDLEIAASLREHLRIPGMGETTTRRFRDKLAMRMSGQEAGLRVPPFIHLLNDDAVKDFTRRVTGPWVLKPRSLAGAIGIKMVHSHGDLQEVDRRLGDRRSFYLLEQFVTGDVFHVDSIVYERRLLFAVASAYGRPPMEVAQQGGIFTTQLLERGSTTEQALLKENARVIEGLGLIRGVAHTEFIRAENGDIYFLETAARVGGAFIADLLEAATGVNLWAEWAKIEVAAGRSSYTVPASRTDYAGLIVSLAKHERPDTAAYNDPEIVWRMDKPHHVGLIVASPDPARVRDLIAGYVPRVKHDFHASAPPRERPSD